MGFWKMVMYLNRNSKSSIYQVIKLCLPTTNNNIAVDNNNRFGKYGYTII